MNNPETPATLCAQDTGRRQTKLINTTQRRKLTRWAYTDPPKNRWWTQVLAKGKHFLSRISNPLCYSYSRDMLGTTINASKHK